MSNFEPLYTWDDIDNLHAAAQFLEKRWGDTLPPRRLREFATRLAAFLPPRASDG